MKQIVETLVIYLVLMLIVFSLDKNLDLLTISYVGCGGRGPAIDCTSSEKYQRVD